MTGQKNINATIREYVKGLKKRLDAAEELNLIDEAYLGDYIRKIQEKDARIAELTAEVAARKKYHVQHIAEIDRLQALCKEAYEEGVSDTDENEEGNWENSCARKALGMKSSSELVADHVERECGPLRNALREGV